MKIETWAVFPAENCGRVNLEIASPQRIRAMEKLYETAGMHYAAVRAEISGAVPYNPARKEDFRIFISTDAYPRICLGILKQDIVARLVLLYEIVLKQKCVSLGLYNGILRICNLGDHDRRLAGKPFSRHEILRNPLVKVLGLAHIDYIPLSVIVSIDAGGMRNNDIFSFKVTQRDILQQPLLH